MLVSFSDRVAPTSFAGTSGTESKLTSQRVVMLSIVSMAFFPGLIRIYSMFCPLALTGPCQLQGQAKEVPFLLFHLSISPRLRVMHHNMRPLAFVSHIPYVCTAGVATPNGKPSRKPASEKVAERNRLLRDAPHANSTYSPTAPGLKMLHEMAEEALVLFHRGSAGGRKDHHDDGDGGWRSLANPTTRDGVYRRSLFPSLWLEEEEEEQEVEQRDTCDKEMTHVEDKAGSERDGEGSSFGLMEALPQDAVLHVLSMLEAEDMARLGATGKDLRTRVMGSEATWPWLQVCLQVRGVKAKVEEAGGREGGRAAPCGWSSPPPCTEPLLFPFPSLGWTGMEPLNDHSLRRALDLLASPTRRGPFSPLSPDRPVAGGDRNGDPKTVTPDPIDDEFGGSTSDGRGLQGDGSPQGPIRGRGFGSREPGDPLHGAFPLPGECLGGRKGPTEGGKEGGTGPRGEKGPWGRPGRGRNRVGASL